MTFVSSDIYDKRIPITTADMRNWLGGIPSDAVSELHLDIAIRTAWASVISYIGYDMRQADHIEIAHVTADCVLLLSIRPVRVLASVVDYADVNTEYKVLYSDDSGGRYILDRTAARATVKVDYTAGFTITSGFQSSIPADIVHAVTITAAAVYLNRSRNPMIDNLSIGELSSDIALEQRRALPMEAVDLLVPYQRVGI